MGPGQLRPRDRQFVTRQVTNGRFCTRRVRFLRRRRFVTQRATNPEGQVKRPQILEIGCREAVAEVGGD